MGGPRGRLISAPDRKNIIELIAEARENGARLEPACEIMGIDIRTHQRWTKDGGVKEDQRPIAKRPTPANKLTDEERKEIIKAVISKEFADLPPCKIVPLLADQGKYIASESTFYRVLREEKLNAHRGATREPTVRQITTHVASSPNQVWTWDITWINGPVKGQFFKLYMIIDIFSRMIVGYEVWETENAFYAEELIRKATLEQKIQGRPLVLHSDNGSPMKSATFQATLEKLGIQSSFSRPRVSDDNPYSEALFKTLKYCLKYPTTGFLTLLDARVWVEKFVCWYNHTHLHSGLNFITPHQRHTGQDMKIIINRIKVYEEAKKNNPHRWSGGIRNWFLPETVALNPINEREGQHIDIDKNYPYKRAAS